MLDLDALTVSAALEAFANGSLTAAQLTQAYLDQITANDHRYHAVCQLSPTALNDAQALDAYYAEKHALKGPLHGVPILVKDQIETKGINTSFGSIAAKDYVPTHDAFLVTKLKDAGAVILGKATMPDWAASFFSPSSLTGTASNPYDLTRETGGSSSGSGAAMAANMCLATIGGDTGGSIRVPSSFCSLVGVRVTPGRISRHGMSSLLATQDTPGPMTKTVEDAARLLDVLVGFDDADPLSGINALAPVGPSFLDTTSSTTAQALRLGVLESVFGSDPHVPALIHSSLTRLAKAGATLVPVTIPSQAEYTNKADFYWTRSGADINAFLAARQPNPTLPTSFQLLAQKSTFHPALDIIPHIATGPAKPEDDPSYAVRLEAKTAYQNAITTLFAQHKLDAIVFPTVPVPAPKTADLLAGKYTGKTFITNTSVASQTCFPAISVPAGFVRVVDDPETVTETETETERSTSERVNGHAGAKGVMLPVGLELLGLPAQEVRLVGVAAAVERVLQARRSVAQLAREGNVL